MMIVRLHLLVLACSPALASVTWPPTQDAVDILSLLNVSESTRGVRVVAGAAPGGLPAYRLRAAYAEFQVPSPGSVAQVLTAPQGFSLVFIYRQQRKSLGTLLSVHSPGKVSPWLQLASNLRTARLLLHYRLRGDPKLHSVTWDVSQPRKGWTHVALSVVPAAGRVVLRLDCEPPREQRLPQGPGTLDIPEDALVYFRQEPGFKRKFLGTMQVAKILPYSETVENLWSCPAA